nr:MAG TPA: hypothetical protein [Caudoviricetes sp.]
MNNTFIQNIKNNGGFKIQSSNSGSRSSSMIGLWQDSIGKQRHVKTRSLGVQDGQGFIISIVDDKIRLTTFSDSEVDELKKNGVNVFKSCSKGVDKNGMKKYQSYAVIEGIDDATWREMVKLNNGVKTYNMNSRDGRDILQHYEVVAYQDDSQKSKAQA